MRYATLAANSHNTQPWRFTIRDRRVSIRPDFSRRTAIVDPDDHHLFVSLGCAAENLAIAAASLGRPAAVAVSDDGHVEIDLAEGAPNQEELYRAIPRRQSTRTVYDGRPVPVLNLKEMEAAGSSAEVSVRLLTSATDREGVLQQVIAGNSAQMDDPAFVAELSRWIRFNPAEAIASGDGLYSAATGNPTLPTWAGRAAFRWVFRKNSENDKYARYIRSSAGFAVFIGQRSDRWHWVQVGRAVQRFALRCTTLGICYAFINQPIEVPAVRRDFARWLGVGEARPDSLVRFGTGPRLPMSMRRPVTAVIDT